MSIGARITRSAETRRMPWWNGGGEIIELAAHPHDAKYVAFDWRISLARIDRDGLFSAFVRVDHTFSVIDGDGVDLTLVAKPPLRLTRARRSRARRASGATLSAAPWPRSQ